MRYLCFLSLYTLRTVMMQLQECMVEHRDWRQCQNEVQQFRKCMASHSASGAKHVT